MAKKNEKEILLFLVPMHVTFESFVDPYSNGRSYKKKDGKLYNSLSTDIPLGPISMSAYLKQFVDVDVRLIDFNVELNHVEEFKFDNFKDYCRDFLARLDYMPSIVGVSSLFSPSLYNFLACGEVAKSLWPSALVIGGGNIPTNSYKQLYDEIECEYFDALCFGEGEKPLKDLLLAKDRNAYLQESRSWITRRKLNPTEIFLPQHDFIDDLDEIPFFDYDLIDIKRNAVNPSITSFHNVSNKIGFHIMTSRGCPYLCTFCASHKTHGRTMRYHSVDRVREDLTKLTADYNASQIIFQDDHLMGDKNRVRELLKIIKDLKLNSLYQNGLTLYALDRSMLEAFYDAGVRHLVLPVESGSEKVLKEQMRKPLKLRISERVAADCRDLGIYTNTNILIGMPGETKADIEEARINLRKIKTNWFNVVCASPLVGSDMHAIAAENNFISGETLGADYHHAVIDTDDFSADYIQHMQYIFNLELNFVYNQDLIAGEFNNALMGFNNVIKIRPDHAIAYYYAAVCYRALGNMDDYVSAKENFDEYSQNDAWSKWIKYFEIPSLNESPLVPPKIQNLTPVESTASVV
jgi:anaerobic magnesium-protoporphyrin IX monomethyl ester cyclase